MSIVPATYALGGRRRLRDRFGDRLLFLVTLLAALAAVALMVAIAYKVVRGAELSLRAFGLGFLTGTTWDATKDVFGAGTLLYGTAVTSLLALLIAGPLAIAIALFLSELAPRGVRGVVGSLVELLAAIPSVVLGLWGILVLGPFVANHLEPWLHRSFGFIPIFSGDPASSGLFVAGLVLAIMVVPIVASICRELFLAVPRELEEGARALGEAIAVTQVIGSATAIHVSLFQPGDTLASRIAAQFQGAVTKLQISSLFYLAAILLVIGLVTNLAAQLIVRRFEFQRTGAD